MTNLQKVSKSNVEFYTQMDAKVYPITYLYVPVLGSNLCLGLPSPHTAV